MREGILAPDYEEGSRRTYMACILHGKRVGIAVYNVDDGRMQVGVMLGFNSIHMVDPLIVHVHTLSNGVIQQGEYVH